MRIRLITEDEFDQVRKLRLAALQDSPNSFADSFSDTQEKPTQYWIELTESLSTEHVMFVLEEDGEPVGSVYGLRDSNDRNIGRVAGMWVSAFHRRRGFGNSLLEQVVSWAKNRGLIELQLWAPVADGQVVEFYSKNGFELTDVRQQTPNPNLEIVAMKRVLCP